METDALLTITHSTSRAAETYGWNRVTLRDGSTGRRYVAIGGGYDMVGTVVADWLESTHLDALKRIAGRAYYVWTAGDGPVTVNDAPDALYGMSANYKRDESGRFLTRVHLDGGTGLDSIKRIAEVIGLEIRTADRDRRGNARAYYVRPAVTAGE